MKFEEFVADVRRRAELNDNEHAEQATQAVLEVLGERMAGGQPTNLAAQLPPEVGKYLDTEGAGERFDVDEFYRRVADREGRGCSPGQGRQHAMAVMSTVVETITPGERDDLASQLPSEYDELLLR